MTNIPRYVSDDILFIFIDLQERLLNRIKDAKKIVAKNIILLESAGVLGIPVIITTQYRKGLGDLTEEFKNKVNTDVLDKTTFSCAGDPGFEARLNSLKRSVVAVGGIETHICVTQTVLDLIRNGRRVAVIADAVGARGEQDHELGLERMENSGAMLVTAEMLIYELLGRSDRPEFKQILSLIK
jgi:nicotinamidase-related amidase